MLLLLFFLQYLTAPAGDRHHTDLSKLTGPARDNLPTSPRDSGPPSTPANLTLTASTLNATAIILKWGLSTDDKIVAGYAVQLARTLPSDATTGSTLFSTSNLALPINADLARFNGQWLGNTDVALLEALASGYRYHARLIARDMAGKWSAWSDSVSLLLS